MFNISDTLIPAYILDNFVLEYNKGNAIWQQFNFAGDPTLQETLIKDLDKNEVSKCTGGKFFFTP